MINNEEWYEVTEEWTETTKFYVKASSESEAVSKRRRHDYLTGNIRRSDITKEFKEVKVVEEKEEYNKGTAFSLRRI